MRVGISIVNKRRLQEIVLGFWKGLVILFRGAQPHSLWLQVSPYLSNYPRHFGHIRMTVFDRVVINHNDYLIIIYAILLNDTMYHIKVEAIDARDHS